MKFLSHITLAASTLFLISCSATVSKNKNFLSSYKGFKQDSKLDNQSTYRGDLDKISKYDSVFLEEVAVLKPEKMEEMQVTAEELEELEKTFRSALSKELMETDYRLASKASSKTLSLRATVTDLHPGNPGFFAAGYIPYVGTAITAAKYATGKNVGEGSAVIEAELLDSVTRERFFAVIDKNAGNKLDIASGMSRWGHVELAFRKWAETFATVLTPLEKQTQRDTTGLRGKRF